MAGNLLSSTTTISISDLPDVILSDIISAVSDTRSRNSAALVSRKWRRLERSTRSSLSLRANLRDLFTLPACFRSVSHLDLSLLSPWGHPLSPLSSSDADLNNNPSSAFLRHLLRCAFPSVTSLTVYSRSPATLHLLSPIWPHLVQIKLIRWHQRPQHLPQGADFTPLFQNCNSITSLDLSSFYCWNDDVPIALQSNPNFSINLTKLNLLNPSFAEGFKSDEIKAITSSCPNLTHFLVACMFDHRYIGFVNDETLGFFPSDCPKLRVLHLVDTSALLNPRAELNDESLAAEDARVGAASLIDMFSGLPLLEELVLDVCRNVRGCRVALEELNSKCPKLKSLKLGQFHGLCRANESNLDSSSRLDGIALCQGLEALSIKNSADLTDLGLIAIARGCSRLVKFEIHGCRNITVRGMRTMVCLLRKTLVEVKISCCKNLGAVSSLKALEPVKDRIQRIHIDCVWDSVEQLEALEGVEYNFDLNKSKEEEGGMMMMMMDQQALGFGFGNSPNGRGYDDEGVRKGKKCKYSYDRNSSSMEEDSSDYGNNRAWEKLRFLSLWISVGELLSPLANSGLQNCPNLEEMRIKVEGDSREWSKPSERMFGLSHLGGYPKLKKMHLDCGDLIGFAQTAPSGQMDLSLWERFYLFGIRSLSLNELDYWPPQDRDVNQRSLSLPAAGLLTECVTLRKLFIHGTANEHFMMMLLRISNIRDVQLREDYYPAPENDMSTEMRADSCSRFEDALNNGRIIPD